MSQRNEYMNEQATYYEYRASRETGILADRLRSIAKKYKNEIITED